MRRRSATCGPIALSSGRHLGPARRHRCSRRHRKARRRGPNIETVSLGDFVAQHAITGVHLLKVDTDGLDLAIIRSGLDWIAEQRPVLFFEYFEIDLRANGDDGLSTLQELRRVGYDVILYYDNLGRFLCATSLANEAQLRQLYAYIAGGRGAFPYYDLCVFHSRDADLAAHVIEQEERFFASR